MIGLISLLGRWLSVAIAIGLLFTASTQPGRHDILPSFTHHERGKSNTLFSTDRIS